MDQAFDFIAAGKRVIALEAGELHRLESRIDQNFEQACKLLLNCKGRVVVTGLGKSGHIGNKIAATLASTGTPAFFIHPVEAAHGDIGMLTREDVVIAISNSGNNTEVLTILPLIKRQNIPLITMTGNPASPMAERATVNLNMGVEKEACSLNLAPTSSTTVTLALGDALAVALLEAKGFTEQDYALSHPSGALGKKLLLRVDDVMHKGEDIPRIEPSASIAQALMVMTEKKLGMTCIVGAKDTLLGIYTDGDVRRTLSRGLDNKSSNDKPIDINNTPIEKVMSVNCKTIREGSLAVEAVQIMEANEITMLVVVNDTDHIVGALNMQDLFRAGVV